MTWRRLIAVALFGVVALALLLWAARARLAAELTRSYFQSQGIASTVDIDALGFAGVSGRFALGPAEAPDVSADRIEIFFDPLRWTPRVVEVRLVKPVIHARLREDGTVTLPSLQSWLDQLAARKGQSRFVSDDLAVSLSGLRALLASPYGAVEMDGDVKLVRNLPVTAALTMRPAVITYGGTNLAVSAAHLSFDNTARSLSLLVAGNLHSPGASLEGFVANLSTTGLRWTGAKNGFAAAAPSLRLTLSSKLTSVGLGAPSLDVTTRDFLLSQSRGSWEGRGDIQVTAGASLAADKVRSLLAGDRVLANAAAANLAHLDLIAAGHIESRNRQIKFSLSSPASLRGAAGGVVKIADFDLHGSAENLEGSVHAALTGKGLPSLTLGLPGLAWSAGAFHGPATLSARFDYAMLHGADITTTGNLSGQAGQWSYSSASCAKMTLAAFRPGPTDMARGVSGAICPAAGRPLIVFGPGGATFTAVARDVAATLPLANAQLQKADGALNFKLAQGGTPRGTITVTSARMQDRAAGPRFNPVLGSGTIGLADYVWQGKFAVTDPEKQSLGDVTFTHTMASGNGSAHIAAPHLLFAAGKLQPETLSPLLAQFRRAEGAADFAGDISWTRSEIKSSGHLAIASLDFLTPLGKAHAVKTELEFVSLLPPKTKDGQAVTISRIDWTLPLSGVDVRFGFSPVAIQVNKVSSDIADGHASLGAFTIDMANPKRIDGVADLSSIGLAALVTASNLGSKLKLEGKVSGHVPFSAGPDGFRVINGHLQADGAGRLSIDRALWAQGADAVSANAVQDFAYQALENLSYDQLSAELNSVAGGRLQIVFHIKGRSDPPKPQQAQVGLIELLNGTALQKPIPLPSGTPIDLTLDTSLNFDELLKSYTEAWSKTLSQGQAN